MFSRYAQVVSREIKKGHTMMDVADVTLSLAFLAGLLSFVSPCVLPLVPAYVGYMGGRAGRNVALETNYKAKVGEEQAQSSRASLLLHGMFFVLGFTVVFVGIGLLAYAFASFAGRSAVILEDVIARFGGALIIVFGLHYMGALRRLFKFLHARPALLGIPTTLVVLLAGIVFFTWAFLGTLVSAAVILVFATWLLVGGAFTNAQQFWSTTLDSIETAFYTDTRADIQADKIGGFAGSFSMGVVFSAGWTPCVGPLLGAVYTLAAQTGDVFTALPLLLAYSMGLGIPFLFTAGLLDSAQALFRRLQRHMGKIEVFSGVLLIVIGVTIASGQLQRLSGNLSSEQVELSYNIEECGLAFFQGELNFAETRTCIGGTLVPVEIGQSARAELSPEEPTRQYVVHVEEALSLTVSFTRITADAPLTVTVLDEAGNSVARSVHLIADPTDEDRIIALQNVPADGAKYTVEVTLNDDAAGISAAEPLEYRIRIDETEENVTPMEALQVPDVANPNDGEVVGSILELAAESGPAVGLDVGNRAPNFTITTIDGQEVSLHDLRGQVVLLNFWGTWCGPCEREMPEFQEVYEEYKEQGFTILALAARDTVPAIEAFRDEYNLTFPLALDEGDEITTEYGIISQPNTFILDRDGVIQLRNPGIIIESQIVEAIEPLLNEG